MTLLWTELNLNTKTTSKYTKEGFPPPKTKQMQSVWCTMKTANYLSINGCNKTWIGSDFSSLFMIVFLRFFTAYLKSWHSHCFQHTHKIFFSLRWKWNEKCCGERRRDDWTENRGEIMKKGLGGQRRLYSKSFGKWQQTHSKCKNASLKNDVWCR